MYLVDGVIRGVFGAVWALLRVPEGIIRKVQLGGYRALWANPGLDRPLFRMQIQFAPLEKVQGTPSMHVTVA